MSRRLLLVSMLLAAIPWRAVAEEAAIVPDVVYGHKFGLAMTYDVYRPTTANGAGVLFMVSGGWYSNWQPPENFRGLFQPLTDKGFTVFAVRHGSSPKFSIPEAVADVRRAVRHVRTQSERFAIDPQRLGVFGMSAGGHLSLMLGTTSDNGEADAKDPVDRQSDSVQAVVAYVAPTDLRIMAWSAPDHLPAYDRFPALDLDQQQASQHSPLVHVTSDDAPTLLIAGDKDDLVPIKHSQDIEAALRAQNVECRLLTIEGAGHGFKPDEAKRAMEALVEWFEQHLPAKP